MKNLWIAASIAAAFMAGVGSAKLVTPTTPAQAQSGVRPLNSPTPTGCVPSRIQVPTANGLQWNKELMCLDSE